MSCHLAVSTSQIPDPPKSTEFLDFGQSSQNTCSKSVFGRALVMACLNINSLVSHIDDLCIFMNQSKGIHILAINETKLDSTIKNNKVLLPGYDVISKDRENNGRRGNVSVFTLKVISIFKSVLNSV